MQSPSSRQNPTPLLPGKPARTPLVGPRALGQSTTPRKQSPLVPSDRRAQTEGADRAEPALKRRSAIRRLEQANAHEGDSPAMPAAHGAKARRASQIVLPKAIFGFRSSLGLAAAKGRTSTQPLAFRDCLLEENLAAHIEQANRKVQRGEGVEDECIKLFDMLGLGESADQVIRFIDRFEANEGRNRHQIYGKYEQFWYHEAFLPAAG